VRRIARAALRTWPAAPVLSAIERAAPRYARLALRACGAGLPRNVRAFPARVAPYFGSELGPAERARLVEARLVFLLIRSFVSQFLLVHGIAGERGGLGPIELRGATYLETALAERRGLLLISSHFGLPPLIGLALEERGLPVVTVGGIMADRVDVVVGRDVWAAARSMQRLRDALADGRACVLLVDTPRGRYMELPFLQGRIPVAAGAFRLAQLTRSPLLPVFAVHASARPRFRVEIGPPLSIPIDQARRRLPRASTGSFGATRRSPGGIPASSSVTSRYSARGACRGNPGLDQAQHPSHAPEMFVRDLLLADGHAEALLEGGDHIDEAERVEAQPAVGERRVAGDLAGEVGREIGERMDQPRSPGGGVERQRLAGRGLSGHSTAPRGRGGALPASSPCRCW
jgi:hypothetical protein